MANYQSPLAQYNQPVEPINLNLLNQALKVNQDKYDTGLQNYESNLAQLKVQENLLLREPDKQRFAQNVQGLIDEVNKGGKMDWSKSGITKRINAYTDTALDDYTLNQIGIAQKVRNFESVVAEKQKKNDGTYSDGNYQYAQYKAGLEDYLKGTDAQGNRVDNIGSLQYENYVDGTKLLKEDIDKWGKDYGIHAEWTKEGNQGDLIYTDVKHNVLTKNDVLQRMKTSLSPQIMNQFKIDAWSHYRGYTPQDIHKDVTDFYSKENANEDINISALEARKKNATKEELIKINNDIAVSKSNKVSNLAKINSRSYNTEQEKTTIYTTSLLNGIAESYEKYDEVERVTNDSNLDIAKFNADNQYRAETLNQGQQRIDIAKEANTIASTANVIVGGSEVDVTDTTEKRTNTAIVETTNNENYVSLIADLQKNDPVFASKKTDAERNTYIKALIEGNGTSNINTEDLPANTVEKLQAYKASSKSVYDAKMAINNSITPVVVDTYNSLLGSNNVKYDNLAQTAPLTVKWLKTGKSLEEIQDLKDNKGNAIGKQTVAMIKHEMAINHLKTADLDSEETHTLQTYIKNLENQTFLSPQQKAEMKAKDKEKLEWLHGYGTFASGIGNAIASSISRPVEKLFNIFANDPTVQDKINEKYNKKDIVIVNQIEKGRNMMYEKDVVDPYNLVKNPFQAINPFSTIGSVIGQTRGKYEDTTLRDVDKGDFNAEDTKEGGFSTRMTGALTGATKGKEDIYRKAVPRQYNSEAIAFNPDDPKGKAIVNRILPQLAKDGEIIDIAKGSVVTAKMLPNSTDIQITYRTKDSKESTTVSVKGEYLPEIQGALFNKTPDHDYNRFNENSTEKSQVFTTPLDSRDRLQMLQKINKNFGDSVISPTQVIKVGGDGGGLYTQIQLRSLSKGQPADKIEIINKISEATYKVTWKTDGEKFTGRVEDMQGNPILYNGDEFKIPLKKGGTPSNYSEGDARIAAIEAINQIKVLQIKSLIEQ